ncbi:hypothetical protein MTR_4g033500 [Medicago truncatula]|uniref:Uncharacterized protein n=1 Tax=Medicago truncatula TaxID=3880 RepID=A0A072UTY9_MEDTR|nr:hypothetical protein MTR_4g033500 [Medicago truncatula]
MIPGSKQAVPLETSRTGSAVAISTSAECIESSCSSSKASPFEMRARSLPTSLASLGGSSLSASSSSKELMLVFMTATLKAVAAQFNVGQLFTKHL